MFKGQVPLHAVVHFAFAHLQRELNLNFNQSELIRSILKLKRKENDNTRTFKQQKRGKKEKLGGAREVHVSPICMKEVVWK